ncbi:MAG: hypothetical protein U0232_27850 [Thermomicrobiales bacterium]
MPVEQEEWGTLAPIRDRWVRQDNGAVDRTPFLWQKILTPYGQVTYAYQIVRGDSPEGYLIYTQGDKGTPLQVLDWCIGSRDAALTLFAFLAGDRAMAHSATLRAAPEDPDPPAARAVLHHPPRADLAAAHRGRGGRTPRTRLSPRADRRTALCHRGRSSTRQRRKHRAAHRQRARRGRARRLRAPAARYSRPRLALHRLPRRQPTRRHRRARRPAEAIALANLVFSGPAPA